MFQGCQRGVLRVFQLFKVYAVGLPQVSKSPTKKLSKLLLRQAHKIFSRCFKGVTKVSQVYIKSVSMISEGCLNGVSKVSQGCLKGVSCVYQIHFISAFMCLSVF